MGYILIVAVGFLIGWHGHARRNAAVAGLILGLVGGAFWYFSVASWRAEAGLAVPPAVAALSVVLTTGASILVALAGHWIGSKAATRRDRSAPRPE